MHLIDSLRTEHRRIESVLDYLERLADQGTRMGTLDWSAAQGAVHFLQEFADRHHHAKEETLLFPLLARKGLLRQYGRTGVMVYEHNQGRRHIRNMAKATADAALGAPAEALKRFLDHARTYVQLMRRHIRKEDHCLFPWVERNLTEDERASLQEAFAAAEQAPGSGVLPPAGRRSRLPFSRAPALGGDHWR
jgi:hemerythrin-like domain-containing protein